MPKRFMVWDRQNKVFLTRPMEIWRIVNHFQGRVGDLVNDDLSDRRYVFCQSTNLFDKDGKEIFEGSIVSDGTCRAVCVWDNSNAEFDFEMVKGGDQVKSWLNEYKIIGHILSNPELLEEEYGIRYEIATL